MEPAGPGAHDPASLAAAVKRAALELGFDACGIAPVQPSVFRSEFLAWLDAGFAGEMAYMARDPERRLDPAASLAGARSIVAVTAGYRLSPPPPEGADRDAALFAAYAHGADYHDTMGASLRRLQMWLAQAVPDETARVYVDTGPLLEREIARLAGIGWFGKNTLLIDTRRGSSLLLGLLLTTAEIAPDAPARGGCGTCRRCIDACPTGAITAPYVLDARRCIAYLTIEQKGLIPRGLDERMGNRVFGCDICQEVCPFNRRAAEPADPAPGAVATAVGATLTGLLDLTDEGFRAAFRGSPVKRSKRRGLLRNAAAALSSRDDADAVAALERALTDPEPLVRDQARQSLEAIARRREPGPGGAIG